MSGVCLGLVHQLAASVANSMHVLESVGGISARYLADDTAAEQATDCFMAAIRGVSKVLQIVLWPCHFTCAVRAATEALCFL